MTAESASTKTAWPALPLEAWRDTRDTLHLWLQIVGKVRLALTPWLNHSWHATFYVTPRGLTTSSIPYGERALQADFDFLEHALVVVTSDGPVGRLPLEPRTVADFYDAVSRLLSELGMPVDIHETPNEIPDAIPFRDDRVHAAYDPAYAERFWRVLLAVDRVFRRFRTGFVGKASPSHLFWGSLDLAVTRFSGRPAPAHPGGIPGLPDPITREAYSDELSSAGFWPGGGPVTEPMFYCYAYPEPAGFSAAAIEPGAARHDPALGELVLPYEAVRSASDPEAVLLSFLQTSYEAAADRGGWDRDRLECALGRPRVPREV
jgi:hypothetical protein